MNDEGRRQAPSEAAAAKPLLATRIRLDSDITRIATLEALAKLLRNEGIARANNNADQWWASCCDTAIAHLASTGVPFTADDVRDLIPAPDHANRPGARFTAAARAGLIRPCGYALSRSRSRHAGVLRLWVGVEQ